MKKPEPKEYPIQPKGWRKKYKCHKNKGDHSLILVYAQVFRWWKSNTIYEEHLCTACKKKVYNRVDW